ncbi:MAG: S-ribosylhomocysteine lyase [Clostridia bacterium]|nr:S-ribosylhomocysteine lyase [Clostridia bacterium]
MKRIASFSVNHDVLQPGIYVSRIDGDAVTYDLRFKTPNAGDYISPKALHTLEHLIATYVRNSKYTDGIIYAGPMGCRTGFYLVLRDGITKGQLLELLKETFTFIAGFEGEIPGGKRAECGNYLEHDLQEARQDAQDYLNVLNNVTPDKMTYD